MQPPRPHHQTDRARPRGWRWAALGLATAALVAGAILVVLSLPATRAGEVVVVTELDRFSPDEVDVLAGGTVVVRNRDWYAHTFTVDDLNVSVYIPPHGERRIELPAVPGTYRLTCEIPGHTEMVGEVHLEARQVP